MAVVIIPNLGATPLIDAVSPDDYFLIGDQSAGGELKRVLAGSLPSSDSSDKLAIADYSFNTIPDKPNTYPPSPHTHPIAEITDLSKIVSTTLPSSRGDGSSLQVFDKWENPSSFLSGFYNGSYWLSKEQYIYTATGRGGLYNDSNYWSPIDLPVGTDGREKRFFIEYVTYQLKIFGIANTDNYFVLTGRARNLSTSEGNLPIVSPNLFGGNNTGKIEVNAPLIIGNEPPYSDPRASLGARLSAVGSPTLPHNLSFSYFIRWILE